MPTSSIVGAASSEHAVQGAGATGSGSTLLALTRELARVRKARIRAHHAASDGVMDMP